MKKAFLIIAVGFMSLTSCHQDPSLPTPSPQTTTTPGNVVTTDITVPNNVRDAILAKYPGYSIYESQKEDSYWEVYYKVTIRQGSSGNTRIVLKYSLDWVYLGIKS
jgi:hypothetical protein